MLIPVYNEEVTREQVVRRVAQLDVAKEILIVDDGSKNRSVEIATRLAGEFTEGRTIVKSLPQSDMEVGYKAFRGELVRSLHLTSNDFRIEPGLTARVLRRHDIRLNEVPISYFGRSFDEGKKFTWRDGKAVRALIKFRFDQG